MPFVDGVYEIYIIQQRRTHESPWCEPDGPLSPVVDDDKKWYGTKDHISEPWHGSGNNWRPKHKKAHDQMHDVWSCTGYHGWWNINYALKGLKRLKKADKKGKLDSFDGYRKRHQAIRHEFRIQLLKISKETEIVDLELCGA